MNRITAQGLVVEAASGSSVVVVSRSHAEGAAAFIDVARTADDHPALARVRYANGRQAVDFDGGGFIRFLSARSPDSLRGLRPDVLYLDGVVLPPAHLDAILATGRTQVVYP